MPVEDSRLVNLCPVFVCPDLPKTVKFYTEKLGFKAARHYDKIENFAALYRDDIELILVQARQGQVLSNTERHGAGYDAYMDPAAPEGVDSLYEEFSAQEVKIVAKPHMTEYGSYEFVIEDLDGRQLGIGLMVNRPTFFEDSDLELLGNL